MSLPHNCLKCGALFRGSGLYCVRCEPKRRNSMTKFHHRALEPSFHLNGDCDRLFAKVVLQLQGTKFGTFDYRLLR